MKKNQYIKLRDRYYQETKEKSETMMHLRKVFADETDRSEKMKSELETISHSLSETIHDISCKEQEVLLLKNESKKNTALNGQLYKVKEDLKKLETMGKGLTDMMSDNGIDVWISYCNIISKQTR
jgi:DNA repair exonuclease SbcCD ATPase subunit